MSNISKFVPSQEFRHSFDTKPFLFEHNLAQHELLSLQALYRLAKKAGGRTNKPRRKGIVREEMVPGFLVVKGRPVRWGSADFEKALDRAFENPEQSSMRMKMSAVNQYEGYRELMDECRQSLSEVTGVDFTRNYNHGIATIFIAAPDETTPYHIDEEVNFLLQIQGLKRVRLFDGNDRKIVSDKDLEEFWFGRSFIDQVPGSSFQTFDISPGKGVFQPPFFPHLITTGPMLSVSLSFPFTRLRFPEAEVYRMNAYLRKYGFKPSRPGAHPAVDTLKSQFIRRALNLKRKVRGE
jgi:hypothetical protein